MAQVSFTGAKDSGKQQLPHPPRANAMRNDPVHLTVISAAAAALLLFPRFCNQTLFDMCFLLVEYVLYTLYTSAVTVVEFFSMSLGIQ